MNRQVLMQPDRFAAYQGEGDRYAAEGVCYKWMTAAQQAKARAVAAKRCLSGNDQEFNTLVLVPKDVV